MKPWLGVVGAFALVVACGMEARAQYGQMGIARGRVLDQNGEPVAGATVHFEFTGESKADYTVETGKDGRFTQMIRSGTYRVTATKDGYRGSYQDVRVRSGTSTTTDLPDFQIVEAKVAAQEAMAPILEKFKVADELLASGKPDEAIAVYRGLQAEYPNIPEIYFNLGSVYAQQEKWPEAEAEYLKVIELQPDNSMAKVLLAETHKNMGRADEAVAAIEQLIAENPDDPELHYNLGVFYLNEQRHEEAFASFDKVRTLDPGNVNVLYLLGTLSINLGETERAVGFFESYLEKAPEDGEYRANASELLARLQPAEAAQK
jgi:tetratricopeptide (TPR) repeat protein